MTQENWTKPPILMLTLKLRRLVLLQQKAHLESQLKKAEALLASQLKRAKRALHGK